MNLLCSGFQIVQAVQFSIGPPEPRPEDKARGSAQAGERHFEGQDGGPPTRPKQVSSLLIFLYTLYGLCVAFRFLFFNTKTQSVNRCLIQQICFQSTKGCQQMGTTLQ